MKRYIYNVFIITALCFIFNSESVKANDWFSYQIVQNGNQLEITYILHSEAIYYNNPCDKCTWDFGDGQILDYPIQEYYTHIYDLNNSSLISNGYFQIDVLMKQTTYSSFTTGECEFPEINQETEQITYYIGEADLAVDFFLEPKHLVYATNEQIDFYVRITPSGASNSNLSYSLKNRFTGNIETGFILQDDLYIKKLIDEYTPTQVGNYLFDLEIYQNNDLIKFKTLNFDVAEETTSGGGGCDCIEGFNPNIDIQTTYDGTGVYFEILDNSSEGFKAKYKPCSNLIISYSGCDQPITLYDHNYGEFTNKSTSCSRPGLFDNPKWHFFNMIVSCVVPPGGNPNDNFVNDVEVVIIDPIKLPETIDVPPGGELIEVETQGCNACTAFEILSSNKSDEEFLWLTQVGWNGSKFKFRCQSNFSMETREFDIRLYFNTTNEKSYSEVDGNKVHYRTIHVKQPSMILNFEEIADNLVGLPDFDFPDGTSHFSFTGTNGEIYFSNSSVVSLSALNDGLFNNGSGNIVIRCYDENNHVIYTKTFSVKMISCTMLPFNKGNSRDYDIYIHSQSQYVDFLKIGDYRVTPSRSLLLYSSSNPIVLREGFHAVAGSNFSAKMKVCSDISKTNDIVVETEDNNNDEKVVVKDRDITLNDYSIRIYPNPSKGIFNIDISGSEGEEKNIQVYDISGKKIQEVRNFNNTEKIDLSNYPSGLYFVRVLVNDKLYLEKIIKQ
ncbi:MAG: T9SS type A sorting domain-containing protein [Bacteroidales bacterium]|nr:T9SS type A sorting domain-containing protein [Bacteroidales bacterium]